MIRILDSETIDFGGSIQLQRYSDFNVDADNYFSDSTRLLACQTGILQKLVSCVNCDFLALLTGPSYSGKRTTVELLARFANIPLRVMQMNSETDAQDLLGSYEQVKRKICILKFFLDFLWQALKGLC
jgi:midasin (ATPase involved in ribosome maturation)